MFRDYDPRLLPREYIAPTRAIVLDENGLFSAFSAQNALNPEQTKGHFGPRLGENQSGFDNLKAAAVLMALVWRGAAVGWCVVCTRRSSHLRAHAGEIALPGGRRDAHDADDIACALREAAEEVALPPSAAQVLGTLPAYVSGSGYCVRPVVAALDAHVRLVPSPDEVAEIFEVPLNFILNPENHFRQKIQRENRLIQWWAMPWHNPENQQEYYIWGATANMFRGLYDFINQQV